MFSSQQQKLQIVNYLSLRTKDLNTEDKNNMTILMHQLFSDEIDMASRLIVRGADIDYVNGNGYSALHLCVENKNLKSVKFLLQKGADPHIMDKCGFDVCDKVKNLANVTYYKDADNQNAYGGAGVQSATALNPFGGPP
mmetsp:Transcript_24015/g.36928  ORF Transcript_24015/g.36928 Transcript_24015/m.36928 type:complete len:139 (-) Transcript_24015:2692-3108(-)